MKTKIIATGSYAPSRVLTNFELEKMVDTTDQWITERTGIKERRIATEEETSSTLAFEAAKRALKSAGIKAKDLDLIVAATVTGDVPFPSTACLLQNMLGAKSAAAFDVNAACSGFLFALSVADKYIKTGASKCALVVGTEMLSKFVDWQDRSTCVLFGDGAGAVILEPTKGASGIMSVDIYSDGSYGDLLTIPAGGSKRPPSKDTVKDKLHCIKMKGNETFKIAVKTLERLALETIEKNNLKPSDISLLIPHQANLRIIQATAERLGISMDKVLVNIDKYGNTSSASIPIALDEAVYTGRIKDGDYVLLEAFGGGLTWASALIKW